MGFKLISVEDKSKNSKKINEKNNDNIIVKTNQKTSL